MLKMNHPGSKKSSRLSKIISIGDLDYKCSDEKDPLRDKYIQLAIISARNLGCSQANPTVDQAIHCLKTNAMETDEDGIVDEINFCIGEVK